MTNDVKIGEKQVCGFRWNPLWLNTLVDEGKVVEMMAARDAYQRAKIFFLVEEYFINTWAKLLQANESETAAYKQAKKTVW